MGIWILANKVSTTHPYLPPNSTTRTPPTHTQEFTDEQGNIIWANYDYAWGGRYTHFYKEQFLNDCAILEHELQPIRFQGQFFDTETSLHYNRFRYYDSDVGMFIQRDPIGLLGGVNVYQYAPNPVGWVDPWGLAKANGGIAKKHGGTGHNKVIDDFIANIDPRATNIRKNQQQVDVNGNKVGSNRPDIQYDLDDIHHNVEFDTTVKGSQKHQNEIPNNDPNSRNTFWMIDDTGNIVEGSLCTL